MPRFSLKTLLIAAAVVPVAAFSLAKADATIAAIVATIAFLAWVAAVIVWRESEGEQRSVVSGCAISALLYAIAVYVTGVFGTGLPGLQVGLLTSRPLELAYPLVAVKVKIQTSFGTLDGDFPAFEHYFLIGHLYWCVLVGLAGGWFAGWLYRRRRRPEQSSTGASSP